MKKNAILVNVARGEVLDLKSALEAVENNHLAGLAIDVIDHENSSLKTLKIQAKWIQKFIKNSLIYIQEF